MESIRYIQIDTWYVISGVNGIDTIYPNRYISSDEWNRYDIPNQCVSSDVSGIDTILEAVL